MNLKPNTRLSKDDCDPNLKPDFHRRYCGIVGGLGYLVTMTRHDLALSYSELSKYVHFPGIAHMEAAEHVLQYLHDTWNESITCGVGLTQIGLATLIRAARTLPTFL